jgi:hypothetical protein
VISGGYVDSSSVFHGFVLTPDGTFTSFDAPGAGTGPGQGTEACSVDCLNPAGATAGEYADANFTIHGFVRALNGTITTFDAAGAQETLSDGTRREASSWEVLPIQAASTGSCGRREQVAQN